MIFGIYIHKEHNGREKSCLSVKSVEKGKKAIEISLPMILTF